MFVEAGDNNQAKITSGGSLFKIMGINTEEFPPLPAEAAPTDSGEPPPPPPHEYRLASITINAILLSKVLLSIVSKPSPLPVNVL